MSVTPCAGSAFTLGTITPIDQMTGCFDYTAGDVAGLDTLCVVIMGTSGVKDTTTFIVTIPPTPDTTVFEIPKLGDMELCSDISEVGEIESIAYCNGQEPTLNLGATPAIDPVTGCIDYFAGDQAGIDTLCIVVCGTNGLKDTSTIVVIIPPTPDTIQMVVPIDSTEMLCADISEVGDVASISLCAGSAPTMGAITSVFDPITGCFDYTAGPVAGNDEFCVVVCGTNGLKDTTFFQIEIPPNPIFPDTVRVTVPKDSTEMMLCADVSMVGPVMSVTPCTGSAFTLGTNTPIDQMTGCFDYTAGDVAGLDTLCVVIMGTDGSKDTTTFIVTIPPTPDTIEMVVPIDSTEMLCADISEVGDVASISLCAGSTPTMGAITSVIDPLTGCFDYTAGSLAGNDEFCVVVCGTNGFKDTTFFLIEIPTNPDTVFVRPDCPICPTGLICATADDITTDATTTYEFCTPNPDDAQGTQTDDGTCIVWTPTFDHVDTIETCVIACTNGICDTTVVFILPPKIIIDELPVDSLIQVCLDTMDLPGNIQSIMPCSPSPLLGTIANVDLTTGCFDYISGPIAGIDTFCIEVCDDLGNCEQTFVIITVNPTIEILDPCSCDDPLNYVFNNTDYFFELVTLQGQPGATFEIDFTTSANIFDDSGNLLSAPQVLTEVSPGNYEIGLWIEQGTPYTITITDNNGLSSTIEGVCDVACNLPPEIEDCPPLTTAMNTPFTKCPTISDPNLGDELTVSSCDMPSASNGTVDVGADNCVTYTPNEGFAGNDEFCVIVCDQLGLCDTTVFSICVLPNPEIEGDFYVCPGEIVTYQVETFNPDNTYTWSVNNNATIIDQDQGSVTVEFDDAPGAFTVLSVSESAGGSCEGTAFVNIAIEDNVSLSCNGGVNISLNGECIAEINASMILESEDYPNDSYTVILVDENGTQLPSNIVGAEYIDQTLEVQVIHDCSGNFCWGYVTIQDKIAPVLECPDDQVLTCDEFGNFTPIEPNVVGAACGDETFEFTVSEIEGTCDSMFAYYVTYTYIATDQSGNVSDPCSYTIFVEKQDLTDLTLPVNFDGLPGNEDPLGCSSGFAVDDNGNPSPSVTGQPGGFNGACANIGFTYTDTEVPLCEDMGCNSSINSYKVIREWVIVEWCTGDIINHTQIIKVLDEIAPEIEEIADMTISTDIWGCGATISLPNIAVSDNCTADESITITYSSSAGTQVGNDFILADPAITPEGEPVEITVTASDCCGNTSSTTFNVTVEDNIPPTVVAETSRSVSLTTEGIAKIFAEDFDDGSHDGCGPIGFFVKRLDNGAGCQSFDEFPPAGNDNAQFNEAVFFCCNDVDDQPVMVQFQVCDDGNQDGIVGNAGDNCNMVMVEVFVEDKLAPVLLCPDDLTVNCIDLNGLDLTDESVLDQMFGTATAAGTCSVDVSVSSSASENCGEGIIIRNFTATTTGGSATCTQFITITPGPTGLLTCDRIQFEGLNNSIYNWCAVNDNTNNGNDDLPALTMDCNDELSIPQLDINFAGLCSEAGVNIEVDTFNFAGGACKKFVVHYEVIDNCIFDENFVDPVTGQIDPFNSANGYFEFFLEVDAFDNEAPTPMCDDVTLEAETCEGFTGSYELPITDNCTDPEFISRLYRLDAFNDGTIDFPATGYVTGDVSASSLGLTEIPLGTHRVFWLINDGCGNETTCSQLITISAQDKAPTPYCFDGLSVAVMPSTGTVNLWAVDFDAGSFGNCDSELTFSMLPVVDAAGLTNEEAYAQSFDHPNVTVQPNGELGFTFDCSYIPNGVTSVNEIFIFVTDENGQWDFCTTSLRLDDNFDACADNSTGTLTISGDFKTDKDEAINEVTVELNANFPEFPINLITEEDGMYQFDNLLQNIDYTVTPIKDDNHLEAITTLDILLIQRHILGIQTLTSPYDMIAADVNNDCKINGLDIIQMRKLLLGKYTNDEFPMNTSWRFVHEDQVFTDNVQPCEFDELAYLENLESSTIENFVGVKIGDVNGSVDPSFTHDVDVRSNNSLEFMIDNGKVETGERVEIPVYASNFNEVYGFQFELNLANMIFHTIEANALELDATNIHVEADKLRLSYNNSNGVTFDDEQVLFTLFVEATNTSSLKEMIEISTNTLLAEAYIGRVLEVYLPSITFRENEVESEAIDFALYQNEPNPFKEMTTIEFDIPYTGEVNFTVYDVAGKVLYNAIQSYPKGTNTIVLDRNDLTATGVLYYKIEMDDFTASKKMIVLD